MLQPEGSGTAPDPVRTALARAFRFRTESPKVQNVKNREN